MPDSYLGKCLKRVPAVYSFAVSTADVVFSHTELPYGLQEYAFFLHRAAVTSPVIIHLVQSGRSVGGKRLVVGEVGGGRHGGVGC